MKTNEQLQKDVQEAIKWEPLLNAAEIGVTAKDGVVTLFGTVDSYPKKQEAERATKNVNGVKAVAENIKVNYGVSPKKNDTEIAGEVLNTWKSNWEVPDDKLKVKVENGWLNLEGQVDWYYQKEAAKKAVANISGVVGVTNNILIKAEHNNPVSQSSIENALMRSGTVNNRDINVHVDDHNVKLTGTVNSLYQKDEAERLAWNAPGVWSVDNNLVVDYFDY